MAFLTSYKAQPLSILQTGVLQAPSSVRHLELSQFLLSISVGIQVFLMKRQFYPSKYWIIDIFSFLVSKQEHKQGTVHWENLFEFLFRLFPTQNEKLILSLAQMAASHLNHLHRILDFRLKSMSPRYGLTSFFCRRKIIFYDYKSIWFQIIFESD